MMRRSFGLEVLDCPRCRERLRLIALIDQRSVIRTILNCVGLPTEVPEREGSTKKIRLFLVFSLTGF